jgi:hypothetical protein
MKYGVKMDMRIVECGMLLRVIMDMRIVELHLIIAGKMKIGLQMMNGNKIRICP